MANGGYSAGVERAMAFMDAVGANPGLRDRIAMLRGRSALADLVEIAKECGFDFTELDYRAAVVEYAHGELSEEAVAALARELSKDGALRPPL